MGDTLTGAVKGIKDWLSVLALVAALGMYIQIVKDQDRRILILEKYVTTQQGLWLEQREEIVRLREHLAFTQEQLRELRARRGD